MFAKGSWVSLGGMGSGAARGVHRGHAGRVRDLRPSGVSDSQNLTRALTQPPKKHLPSPGTCWFHMHSETGRPGPSLLELEV